MKREMLLLQKQIGSAKPRTPYNRPSFDHSSSGAEVSPIGEALHGKSFSVKKLSSGGALSSSRYKVSR